MWQRRTAPQIMSPLSSSQVGKESLLDSPSEVPGKLDIKGEIRCDLLLNKRWNLLPPFLYNEPGKVILLLQKE
jgi:hypothetical protein